MAAKSLNRRIWWYYEVVEVLAQGYLIKVTQPYFNKKALYRSNILPYTQNQLMCIPKESKVCDVMQCSPLLLIFQSLVFLPGQA